MVKEGFYLVIVICIVAAIAAIVGNVAPQLDNAAVTLAAIQHAPQRAQARAQTEIVAEQARIERERAQTEIAKANALAAADVARLKAQAELARVEAEQKTLLALGLALVALVSIGVIGYLRVRDAQAARLIEIERQRIEASKVVLLEAINQGKASGIAVTLPNGHGFTLYPISAPLALPPPAHGVSVRAPVAAQVPVAAATEQQHAYSA